MNLQEFKDKLRNAGWESPHDAQGTNIKKLWMETFPKDFVINGLMKKIDDQDAVLQQVVEWLDQNGHGKDIRGHENCFACGIRNKAKDAMEN